MYICVNMYMYVVVKLSTVSLKIGKFSLLMVYSLHLQLLKAKSQDYDSLAFDAERLYLSLYEPRHEKTNILLMRRQTQISFPVAAKLTSDFVFAT